MVSWALVGYAFAVGVGGAVGIALTTYHDRREAAYIFGLFAISIAIWAGSNAGRIVTHNFGEGLLFTQLTYVGVLHAPVLWFVFTLLYTGHGEWLTRRRVALLFVIPVLSLPLIFTAQYHSFYYSKILFDPNVAGPALETVPGPWYFVTVGYSYALLVIGLALLVGAAFAAERLYRRQSVTIILCALVPVTSLTLYLLGFRLLPNADISPILFAVVSVPLGVVIHHTEINEIAPVAHKRIFQTLNDPVFVCDRRKRVIEINSAACDLLDEDRDTIEDSSLTSVLPDGLMEDGDLHSDLETAFGRKINFAGETKQYVGRWYSVDPRLMKGSQGMVLTLIDVTHQKRQQEALEQRNEALAEKTDRLETKNEQLERLADIIAHDIETPLTTAGNLLQLIKMDCDYEDNPDLKQSLVDLESVHGRLEEFSEAIPKVARESADVESTRACDLEQLARSAWEVVETEEVTLSIAETATLETDPRRIKSIFENLFQNAVEHGSTTVPRPDRASGDSRDQNGSGAKQHDHSNTENGSGETTVSMIMVGPLSDDSTTHSETDGFYIEDDGPGIPRQRREDVLKFGVGTGSGKGYGLAIVRAIVEAHGWMLRVTTASSGGARFEIVTN